MSARRARPAWSNAAAGQPEPDLFSDQAECNQRVLDMQELLAETRRYASGMSRLQDLVRGGLAVGGAALGGIGVEVGELSRPAIAALVDAVLLHHAAVFVDSGAFGAFRRGVKSGRFQPLDFNAILAAYDGLLDGIDDFNNYDPYFDPAAETDEEGFTDLHLQDRYESRRGVQQEDYPRPLLVMPDVVGDQAQSLALVEHHRRWISARLQSNAARIVIPLQKGALTLAQAYRRAVRVLGNDTFISGIPSNAAAVSRSELTAFLREARPAAIHVLGAASARRLVPRLGCVIDAGLVGQVHVTADASPMRSHVLGAVQDGARRSDAIAAVLYDDTDPGHADPAGMPPQARLGGRRAWQHVCGTAVSQRWPTRVFCKPPRPSGITPCPPHAAAGC